MDETKKTMFNEFKPYCRKIFGVDATAAAGRMRRGIFENMVSSVVSDDEDDDAPDSTPTTKKRNRNDDVDEQDSASATASRFAAASKDTDEEGSEVELDGEHFQPHNRWLNGQQKKV